jgi:arginine exporter protein ArgO
LITTFLQGVAAGLAIAVPVGAIGILIIETGIRRGFRVAWAAGAGTASADGIYATVAAGFGAALAGFIAPWERPLRVAAIVILVALAVRGLASVTRAWRAAGAAATAATATGAVPVEPGQAAPATPAIGAGPGPRRTYVTFLGLTMMNPQTVVYFAALILALGPTGSGVAEKAAFVAGAFGASLAWQSLVASAGALLHRRLSPGLRIGVALLGNVIILVFAAAIARDVIG